MDTNKKDKIDEFVAKTLAMKKQDRMDLSSDEDLSIAVMNLISLEEHFFFSGAKTKNRMYYDLLAEIRDVRKNMLKRIIKEYDAEVWCISKHLLAVTMRLMEYGTKLQTMGKMDEAVEIFEKAYDMYSLFWGLNLNLIDKNTAKKYSDSTNGLNKMVSNGREEAMDEEEKEEKVGSKKENVQVKQGFFGKLGDMVKKAVDCCIE